MAKNKKARAELAQKKAKDKRKKLILISAGAGLALVGIILFGLVTAARTERYGDGNASIELRPSGRFSATLYHERFSGTYTRMDGAIAFTVDGVTVTAELDGELLFLPEEWDDDHGHGSVLFKY